jgi:hypothetical protein
MSSHRFFGLSAVIVAATLSLGNASSAESTGIFGRIGHIFTNPIAAANDPDARQGSIQERLRDAMEAGRLTDDNLHSIKEQLQKVAGEEAAFKAKNGEMSGWQTLQLQVELDKISKELEADLTERKGGPVDIVSLRNALAARITDALAVGKINQQESDQFNADLAQIDKQIAASKAPDGTLATNDQVRIALSLDNLSQRFVAGEHQRQADLSAIDKRRDEIRAMIRGGVAEGKLTEDEVDDIRQQLYSFEDKESRMGKIGRPLTGDEELSLALELERFGAEVRARMDNGTGVKITDKTIGYRKNALDQTFANALFAGDISVAEAQNLKTSLDQIGVDEAGLRSQAAGQLTAEQIRTLLIAVEKLKGQFSRLTYNRQKPWSGVDGQVNDIKQKIATATASKVLSEQESDDLQSKIADVLVAKSNERNTQGFVTTDAAIKLAGEITALGTQVAQEIGSLSVISLPEVQKRQQDVNRKLADGIDSGKLSASQAAPLVAQYKTIIATQANLGAGSGNGGPQQSTLSTVAASLQSLSTAVAKAQHDNTNPLVPINQLKHECDREITARTYNGKLTAKEAASMRSEYNRIDQFEKKNRAAASGFDAVAAMTVETDLTNLMKNIKAIKNTTAAN